jgi:glycosyltransferase involved in cell wall biosynthesis
VQLAALIKNPDDPVYRYRLHAFEPELRRQGWHICLHSLPRKWLMRLPLYFRLPGADVVLLQRRLLGPAEIGTLRRFARRLVYDFDDAVMYRSSNSPKGPDSRRREARFRTILEAADVVVAGNRFLADVAERYIHPFKIYRIPTCVDPHQYVPASHENESSNLQLVWIGSASTVRTLNGFSPRLKAVASAVPKAQLKVICDVFPDAMPMPIVRCLWSAEREASDLASADVGISWMPDGPWSQGKCGLKLLQYMAAGLPVVANPVGVHREMVVHGKNGFLAETPEEWVEAIQSLARDAELRKSMGSAGRKAVLEGYSPGRWADVFVKVVSGVAGIKKSSSDLGG